VGARADGIRGLPYSRRGKRGMRPRSRVGRRVFDSNGDTELAMPTTFDLAEAYGRVDAHRQSLALALESERALEARALVDCTLQLEVLAYLGRVRGHREGAERYRSARRGRGRDQSAQRGSKSRSRLTTRRADLCGSRKRRR